MIPAERQPEKFLVHKVLNNNVILASREFTKQELILVGKGIGFGSKSGQVIELPPERIEKSYISYDEVLKRKYLELINELNGEVLGLGEEIIVMAERELGSLNPHIHIALTDHISFALERLNNNLDLRNPFLEEIKILYPEEYKLGCQAAVLIKERMGVAIPEGEIGFIALHLHAARQNRAVSQTVKYTSLIKDLVKIVEKEIGINFSASDLSYARLITHLRFSLTRMERDLTVENPLLETIKREFAESFKVAGILAAEIEKRLQFKVSEDELGFIALHLQRLKK